MKRKILLLFALFLLMAMPNRVDAAITLHGMDIDVYLNPNGDGDITVIWESTQDSSGTENYIPITNLGGSTIRNFRVSEEGVQYTENPNWDSGRSREEKNHTYGVLDTAEGVELVWGIGEPGRHQYKLEYTVTGLVKELEDQEQILFWQFVNYDMSNPPQEVRLQIRSDFPIQEDNARIWAFGFGGSIHFVDGNVVAETSQALTSANYVTTLVKFEPGTFSTASMVPGTFESIRDRAFEGSDYQVEEDGQVYDSNRGIRRNEGRSGSPFDRIGLLISPGVVVGMIGVFLAMLFGNSDVSGRRNYRAKFKGEYEREMPFHSPLEEDFYPLNRMGITGVQEIITAWILKWILEGRVQQSTVEEGFLRKREETALALPDQSGLPPIEGEYENQLFRYMQEAAGADDTLSSREFSRWAQRNTSKMLAWEKNIYKDSREIVVDKGYYAYEGRKRKPKLTQEGEKFEERVHKFHNYLTDFSLLSEREAAQVHIWDQLMISAGLMGITDKVEEEFRKIYPEYAERSTYSPGTMIWVNSYASSLYRSYHSSSSGSSGGGGSSSFGGGGGSFGGGGGGGTR